MKTLIGFVFAVWLAVTGVIVLSVGIGWNGVVLSYFANLPNANGWAYLAPFVYILWVIMTGVGFIGAGAGVAFWATQPPKKRSLAGSAKEAIDLRATDAKPSP